MFIFLSSSAISLLASSSLNCKDLSEMLKVNRIFQALKFSSLWSAKWVSDWNFCWRIFSIFPHNFSNRDFFRKTNAPVFVFVDSEESTGGSGLSVDRPVACFVKIEGV